MPPQTDTLDLVPDRNTVKSATQWLETICRREHWPSAVAFALTLSLDEALTNIVSYAFQSADHINDNHRTDGDSTPRTICLRCTSTCTQVRLEIIDNGRPYDPTQSITPSLAASLDEAHLGGHGLRLMRHYLSGMSYVRRRQRNCLTLLADLTNSPKG
ncbi:ATP-binding protein [Bordetella muralis]|uniref:ATP-binding protein n=1 Tax=Bordetella muralis TaxID=1649130 RepID=UPI0039EF4B9D